MNIPYHKSVLAKVLSVLSMKKHILNFLVAVGMYSAGTKVYLVGIFTLVIFDALTGVMAARQCDEKFESKKFRKGWIDKIDLYSMLMFSVFILEYKLKTMVSYDPQFMLFTVTFLVASYECISVVENIYTIYPKMAILKTVMRLIGKLQDKVVEKAENAIDNLGDEGQHDGVK
ncbi:phage holin family protein [Limnovirga soli]|uniref:Holin n=1 Tax=Limnovirga soli TaxID=2656915 RepID=A0A8J8FIZ0_9BACT|nr:phage holin family protein [Limnovirga soli]NNV57209.1 hypothetical protein [Limnovirga soli]